MALDAPPHARTRLRDVSVSGASPLIEGGTITVHPGTRLEVEVVDGAGAPVAGHDVFLTDPAPLSPITFQPMKTDQLGRVSFDRLAPGQYALQAASAERCNGRYLAIARDVTVPPSGSRLVQLVIGGRARVRLTSSGSPRAGIAVTATPADRDVQQQQPFWLRGPFGLPCLGVTDADGRATFPNFPPGRARIDVRLPNSTLIRRVAVPARVRDVTIDIPSGYLPLRVSSKRTGNPVPDAMIAWFSSGFRIEATTTATGEVLLDGIAAAGGTLRLDARGYQVHQARLPEAPPTLYEVALAQTRDAFLECRVLTASGEPIADAVVELVPQDLLTIGHVTTTNAQGIATFLSAPKGAVRLVARAEDHAAATVDVPADAREATVTLAVK
jgi:hypothetical protein